MASTSDVLIIGGGVIGLTTAYRLAEQGVSVIVADRQTVGREASWAGAGMLPPGHNCDAAAPETRLRSYSHSLWSELSCALKERTGIDSGYLRCGSIELATDDTEFDAQLSAWQNEGIAVEELSRGEIEKRVPDLHPEFQRAAFLPDFGQARNPRHLKGLSAACRSLGVEILEHEVDLRIQADDHGRVTAVTPVRSFAAEKVCVTAGSWSRQILQPLGVELPVKPVRGQIVQLRLSKLPFTCVIERGRRYIVPRADGLILIGSTEEHVGFDKRTTADGVAGLLEFARCIAPELGSAELVNSWAGLRPGSPDELPFLGRVAGFANLYVGAGHFRSGLQMSTGTGSILAEILQDREPPVSLRGLTVDRFVTRKQ